MLTKLLPDQISKFWPIIKYAVEQSLPPIVGEHPDKMNRVLSAMLCDKLTVWASYTREGEITKFEAILVTQIIYDEASSNKNLLMYCLYGYTAMSKSSWIEGYESLIKYAKAQGCSGIIAYSANSYVVETAKNFGADTSYTFINFTIPKSVK